MIRPAPKDPQNLFQAIAETVCAGNSSGVSSTVSRNSVLCVASDGLILLASDA